MNTSKRKQKAIRLGIAAVLALVLLVSVSVVLVIANDIPTVQADAMKVTLDGKVNLIFKYEDGTVKPGTVSYTAVIGAREPITGLISEKVDGKNVVTVPLMPYEMTEEVKLYHVDKDGNYLAVSTGSVRAYADKVLASDNAADNNKIRALLNYGAMTQVDAGSKSTPANDGLFVRNNPIDIIKEVPFGELGAKTGNTDYFEGKVSVSLAFKGGDIALRYTVIGVESAPTATFKYGEETVYGTFVKKDGSYKFDISNVGVNDFDTVWDVTITSGENTVTYHNSVLEYLDWVIDNSEDTEKDVARSLYQLYQNTAGSLLTKCDHLNPGYYIPAGENSSYHMCAACGKEINADPIDNKTTAYFSGEHLSAITPNGDVTPSYSDGDGYQITFNSATNDLELIWLREAYNTSEGLGKADGKWGDVPFDIGNAKYIIIRSRVNSDSKISRVYAYLGSTEWTAENALKTGEQDQGSVIASLSENRYANTCWCTAVLSLDKFGEKVKADKDGNRVIDSFKLSVAGTVKAGDTLTIDSIEFVTHLGECVNMDKDSKCDDCGKELATSAYVMNGTYLKTYNQTPGNGDFSLDRDGTLVANRRTDGYAQMAFIQNKTDYGTKDYGTDLNVGQSEYIVLKYKVDPYPVAAGCANASFTLLLSTKSYNGYSSISVDPYPKGDAVNADGWTYMVIHAPTAMLAYDQKNAYVADKNGDYIIDYFYIQQKTLAGGSQLEIGYIAFAETLDDVEKLFADDAADDNLIDNVIMAKKSYPSDSSFIHPVGTTTEKVVEKVVNGQIQHALTTTIEGGKATTVCTKCNRPVLRGDTFIDGNLLVNGASGVASSVNEDGNMLYHLETTSAYTHLWIREPYKTGVNSSITLPAGTSNIGAWPGFTTVKGDKKTLDNDAVVTYPDYSALNVGTAKYLVVRARSKFDGASSFFLYMGTVGYHAPAGKGADQCTMVRFNTANDNEWITYVLDLSNDGLTARAPTVKDSDGNDIRIFDTFYLVTAKAGKMDIDFIAFVDELADVADITVDDSVRMITDISTGASTPTKTADLKN